MYRYPKLIRASLQYQVEQIFIGGNDQRNLVGHSGRGEACQIEDKEE